MGLPSNVCPDVLFSTFALCLLTRKMEIEMKDYDLRDAITDELLQGHCITSEGAADWHW